MMRNSSNMNMNNLAGMMNQVMRQVGNGNPNDFLNAFVQNNRVPQNVLNEAQRRANSMLPQIQGVLGKK